MKYDKVHHQITSHNRDCTILTRMYICFLWVKEGWSDRFLLVRVRFLWLQTRSKHKSLSLNGRSTDVSLCDIELLAFPEMTSNTNNDRIRRLHSRSQNFNFGSKYYHQVNCNKYFLVDKRLRLKCKFEEHNNLDFSLFIWIILRIRRQIFNIYMQ